MAANENGLEIIRKIEVKDHNGKKRRNLNELEYVKGTLFSNVYMTDRILNIDLEKGLVLEEWLMSRSMYKESTADVDWTLKGGAVLNGIAYHKEEDYFLLTGKLWKHVYKMKLI